MLRVLRILGVVVFVFLIGLSANSLREMHETGELLERYNSRRKADITLLVVSFIALGALSHFELARLNRTNRKRRYGDVRETEEGIGKIEGLNSSSIYSAPQTIDRWEGRRTRTTKSKNKVIKEPGGFWLSLLKMICTILPLLYLGLTIFQLMSDHKDGLLAILLPTVFCGLFVLSVITFIGVMFKKSWGLSLGYIMAVFNLFMFPIGTGIGLFLIIGLVGASPIFADLSMERRRAQRRKVKRAPTGI